MIKVVHGDFYILGNYYLSGMNYYNLVLLLDDEIGSEIERTISLIVGIIMSLSQKVGNVGIILDG